MVSGAVPPPPTTSDYVANAPTFEKVAISQKPPKAFGYLYLYQRI